MREEGGRREREREGRKGEERETKCLYCLMLAGKVWEQG